VRAPSGKPLPPVVWEIVAASLLLAWRAWAYGWSFLVGDWFSILCGYWIFTALASRTRAWPYVTALLMAGLLVLYGWHQAPFAWATLGLGR
jgi:hypothetical protein